MNLRRFLIASTLLGGLVLLGAYVFRAPLSVAVAERLVVKRLNYDRLAELPDGLHVGLCGAGSPFPDEQRGGPCTLVVAGKRLFVFDAGNASVRNIGKMNFNTGSIEAIFLTHFHSDHLDGLGELMLQRWVSASNTQPVPVHGPEGVQQLVAGFMQAYAQDQHYRVVHHGDAIMPATGFGGRALPFKLGADGRVVVLKDGDLEITAFTVDHGPVHPAIGYVVRYKGRSLVLSGDTKKSALVQREAQNVDLLVHEALSTPLMQTLQTAAGQAQRKNLQQIFLDVQNYHSSPEDAATIARDAKVGFLLLNHIAPPLPLPGMERAFLGQAKDIYSGPIKVGQDGDFVSLPIGSKDIAFKRGF